MYALVDCNNFFVSCERLFRPDLEGKPVVVLSNNDGCFISRSQEAKDIGLPMGAPLFKWKNEVKTHGVTLFSANFELYGDISERIVTLLREVTPLIEVYSIDECFMDLSQLNLGGIAGGSPVASQSAQSGLLVRSLSSGPADRSAPHVFSSNEKTLLGQPRRSSSEAGVGCSPYDTWAQNVRERIWREIGIPVSIGVAPTKTLAKVASTYAKKHGGTYVVSDEPHREQLLEELPIEDIWGVGWRMAPKLRDQGISRAMQLVSASDAWLHQRFNVTGMRMIRELRGEACIPFGDAHDARKSIMRSRSFGHRVREYHHLESAISTFAAQATARLRAQDSVARHIMVFLSANRHVEGQKRVYLSTLVTLTEATSDTARFITAALEGLEQIYDDQYAYQKAGVTILGISSCQEWQLSMLSDETRRDERADLMSSIDQLNRKYGHVVYHASEKSSDDQWRSRKSLCSPRYATNWAELPTIPYR